MHIVGRKISASKAKTNLASHGILLTAFFCSKGLPSRQILNNRAKYLQVDLSSDMVDSGGAASEIIALVRRVGTNRNIAIRHAQYCAMTSYPPITVWSAVC